MSRNVSNFAPLGLGVLYSASKAVTFIVIVLVRHCTYLWNECAFRKKKYLLVNVNFIQNVALKTILLLSELLRSKINICNGY